MRRSLVLSTTVLCLSFATSAFAQVNSDGSPRLITLSKYSKGDSTSNYFLERQQTFENRNLTKDGARSDSDGGDGEEAAHTQMDSSDSAEYASLTLTAEGTNWNLPTNIVSGVLSLGQLDSHDGVGGVTFECGTRGRRFIQVSVLEADLAEDEKIVYHGQFHATSSGMNPNEISSNGTAHVARAATVTSRYNIQTATVNDGEWVDVLTGTSYVFWSGNLGDSISSSYSQTIENNDTFEVFSGAHVEGMAFVDNGENDNLFGQATGSVSYHLSIVPADQVLPVTQRILINPPDQVLEDLALQGYVLEDLGTDDDGNVLMGHSLQLPSEESGRGMGDENSEPGTSDDGSHDESDRNDDQGYESDYDSPQSEEARSR